MWRNISKLAASSSRKSKLFSSPTTLKLTKNSSLVDKSSHFDTRVCTNYASSLMGLRRFHELSRRQQQPSLLQSSVISDFRSSFATSAEAIASTTDEESGSEEVQEMLEGLVSKAEHETTTRMRQRELLIMEWGKGSLQLFGKRQIKIETEAWEEAANAYQDLLTDMCERKLAPNLPYIKSLFLGWFEPFRDAIAAEPEIWANKKHNRPSHSPYFEHLPPNKMAVITMHKLMGLMMANNAVGSVKVVQAACAIGEALEHEVKIHRFLLNKKKTSVAIEKPEGESDTVASEEQEQENLAKEQRLRRKVHKLLKSKKLQQVNKILKEQDELKPWGQEGHVKVGCRLIQLLIQTAYIQPPVDQLGDTPVDIHPAFIHSLKTITKDGQKTNRRYGVIECDPLICKGME